MTAENIQNEIIPETIVETTPETEASPITTEEAVPAYTPNPYKYTEEDVLTFTEQAYKKAWEDAQAQAQPQYSPMAQELNEEGGEEKPLTLKDLKNLTEEMRVQSEQKQYVQGITHYQKETIPQMINALNAAIGRPVSEIEADHINLKYEQIQRKHIELKGYTPQAVAAAANEHAAWMQSQFVKPSTGTSKMEQAAGGGKSGIINSEPQKVDINKLPTLDWVRAINGRPPRG